ncbi:MAG: hypothetical protein R2939_15555 [Kofleriaceae bacterium]
MQCPYCEGDSSVTETRVTDGGLRRRRVCSQCRRRFTTYEKVGSPGLKVDKRSRPSEPFDGDKLLRCLRRVSRGRPEATTDALRRLARDIEATLLDAGQRVVRWREIVVEVLRRLEAVDAVAAARFRANYVDEQGALRLEPEPEPAPGGRTQLPLPGVADDPS